MTENLSPDPYQSHPDVQPRKTAAELAAEWERERAEWQERERAEAARAAACVGSPEMRRVLARRLKDAKQRAKRRGRAFDITLDYLLAMHRDQPRCRLTSEALTPENVSLDRIDSRGGYTRGNVQLTTIDANRRKQRDVVLIVNGRNITLDAGTGKVTDPPGFVVPTANMERFWENSGPRYLNRKPRWPFLTTPGGHVADYEALVADCRRRHRPIPGGAPRGRPKKRPGTTAKRRTRGRLISTATNLPPGSKALSVAAIAAMTGKSKQAVYKWISTGVRANGVLYYLIPSVKTNWTSLKLISPSAFRAFVRETQSVITYPPGVLADAQHE